MHKTLDVITIGEAMAMFVATETGELSAVEHFIKRVAGAELNVATGLARLGLNVGWVSRVGNDSFGHFVLDSLKFKPVNTLIELYKEVARTNETEFKRNTKKHQIQKNARRKYK